jgi:hypothetical protein
VFPNLSQHKLEKLQLDAARIVTGLPIFTKWEYLYAETGWETLSERRYRRKLHKEAIRSLTSKRNRQHNDQQIPKRQ